MTQIELDSLPHDTMPHDKMILLDVIITGDSGVGKSWLMHRFANKNITTVQLNSIPANIAVTSLASSDPQTDQRISILFVTV